MPELNEEQKKEQVAKAADDAKKDAENKGLSQEEVNTAVEKARQQEKDKLYPQLEEVRSALKEVQEALRLEREDKEKVRREVDEKAETERQAKLSADERQIEILNRLEEQVRQEREARAKLEETINETRRQDGLKAYRERALTVAGDKILPELVELVTGNTEIEIDAAIRTVTARTEEIAKRFKETRGEEVKNSLRNPNPNTAALEEQDLDEQLTQVDMSKYLSDEEYRKKIQLEIDKAYQKSVGRV